jgi:hypothetical protein
VRKRVCYVHIGPHKTGTSSIQWFLKENRTELLKHGYFVPESRTSHGAHHPLARKLCGQELADHKQLAATDFVRQLNQSASQAVLISSETLDGLLRNADYARTFFSWLRQLELEPKLIFFPRNQPQWINSRYAQAARGFSLSEPFESFASGVAQRRGAKYSVLVELADTYNATLIARPFTAKTIANGIVPMFLQAIGADPSQFRDTDVRRNQTVGPFTVSVARRLSRSVLGTDGQFTCRQAGRCKTILAAYLEKKGLQDFDYCGLSTAMARQMEATCRSDNDAFAQRVWDCPWNEIFADDVGQEFAPNDFDICEPPQATQQLLSCAVSELIPIVEEIMRNPILAVDAPWNDFLQRAGWPATDRKTVSVSRCCSEERGVAARRTN